MGTLITELNNYNLLIFSLTTLSGLLIFPIIYNLWVIPKIERKIGRKLKNDSVLGLPFDRFLGRYDEVMYYTVFRCFGVTRIPSSKFSTLAKVNYDIKEASKAEIIVSFFAFINTVLWFISVIVGLLILSVN